MVASEAGTEDLSGPRLLRATSLNFEAVVRGVLHRQHANTYIDRDMFELRMWMGAAAYELVTGRPQQYEIARKYWDYTGDPVRRRA